MSDLLDPIHPGEILNEDFLKPNELSQSGLARAIGVPPRRINEIVLGKRAITAETDLLLASYFGVTEGVFLSLQMEYELAMARRTVAPKLARIRETVALTASA